MKLHPLLLEPLTSNITKYLAGLTQYHTKGIKFVSKREIQEKNITAELIDIIQKNREYSDFKSILQMKDINIYGEKDLPLLLSICTRIAKSVAENFHLEQDIDNHEIINRYVFCDFFEEDITIAFGYSDKEMIYKKLLRLNLFLLHYGVELKYWCHVSKRVRFQLWIFPSK